MVNASKVTADIRRDFAENLPFTRDSAEGCTRDMSLYDGIWDKDFHGRLQATRALTMIFMLCGALKVFSVMFSTIFCEARGGAGITTLVQVLAGWAGWLVFLWILLGVAGARRRALPRKRGYSSIPAPRMTSGTTGDTLLAVPRRDTREHVRRDVRVLNRRSSSRRPRFGTQRGSSKRFCL